MKDVIITSSVLITALLILRRLFTKTISRRFQYALWSLVLLRLLIPVSLPAVNFSVLTAAQPAQESVTAAIDSQIVYYRPAAETPAPYLHVQQEPIRSFTNVSSISDGYSVVSEDGETSVTYSEMLTLSQILRGVWIFGMIVMAFWFAASNLRFYIMLRKNRTPFVAGLYTHRVWLVEKGLSSPCLFGLIKPSFYLTPASAADEQSLRYVMLHEETHVQHHDLLWSFLRCVCLTVYWFNPLVWLAAAASRTDCELACDESVIRTLNGAERIAYGKTLLSMVPVKSTPQNPLLSATTMTAGKKKLKDRIVRIAENRSTAVTALAAVIVIAALVCTVTFTSAADKAPSEDPPEEDAENISIKEDTPINNNVPDISQLQSNNEVIPTVYPDSDPVLTISLDNLEPYEAPKIAIRQHTDDCAEILSTWSVGGTTVYIYLSTDSNIYAAVPNGDVTETWDVACFLYITEEEYTVSYFSGLFGNDGLAVSFRNLNNYYVFDADGTPSLLLRAIGRSIPEIIDLDSNGDNELIVSDFDSAYLFYRYNNQIYEVNFSDVMKASWSEMEFLEYCHWNTEYHYLYTRWYAKVIPEIESSVAYLSVSEVVERKIYFNRNELLVYDGAEATVDHVTEGITAPDYVLSIAKDIVLRKYNLKTQADSYEVDDWRISGIHGPYYEEAEGLNIECWELSHELHTTTPELVIVAGGTYITEHHWVHDIFYPECLYFLINDDGTRTFMYSETGDDFGPGSEAFLENLLVGLRDNGYLPTE